MYVYMYMYMYMDMYMYMYTYKYVFMCEACLCAVYIWAAFISCKWGHDFFYICSGYAQFFLGFLNLELVVVITYLPWALFSGGPFLE